MPSTDDVVEYMRQNMGALNQKMGVELVEVTPEKVVGTMPVDDATWTVAVAATAGLTGVGDTATVVVERACDTVRRAIPADVLNISSAP